MHQSEQIKTYLLWLRERGIPYVVPTQSFSQEPVRSAASEQTTESNQRLRVLFLTDIPHADENGQWTPMGGKERDLLDRMILAMQIPPEETHIFAAFPPLTSLKEAPSLDLIGRQKEALLAYITKLKPQLVIALGQQASHIALGDNSTFLKNRGRILTSANLSHVEILPTLHPRDLLRFPENKRLAWGDLKKAMEHMEDIAMGGRNHLS